MDQLNSILDELLQTDDADPVSFYATLTNLKVDQKDEKYFKETLLPKVYHLYEKGILKKDLVYLDLLASHNFETFHNIVEYEHSINPLDLDNPGSIYDYCIYTQSHWVYKIIDDALTPHNKLQPLSSITNKLKLLRFIKSTNLFKLDISEVNTLIPQINRDYLDDFWRFYIEEIQRLIDVAQFCHNMENLADTNEVFKFASKNSLLQTLSVYLKFEDPSKWDLFHEKMTQWETISETEESKNSTVFIGFVILSTVINVIIIKTENNNFKKTNINKTVDNIKTKLLSLSDRSLQIDVLENIFSLLFYRNKRDEFVCECPEVRLILLLLKPVIEELELKKVYDKDTEEYRRLQALHGYVADGLWRLEVISNIKSNLRQENQLVNYMLAPAESLIHLCLKKADFERAYQVIKIFDLNETPLARDLIYSERLVEFSGLLRKRHKTSEPLSKASIQNYFDLGEGIADMFDFAITAALTQQDSNALLELAEENSQSCPIEYLKFYRSVVELAKEIWEKRGIIPISDILNSSNYPLDLVKWQKSEEFYETLALLYDEFANRIKNRESEGIFNKNHPTHKTLLKINDIISNGPDSNNNVQLLSKVFNYLQAFSKVLYIVEDSSEIVAKNVDTSYFELLDFNRSELMGQLLFERNLDPTEFELYFAKLKLDFLYHVVGNCFPTINLHVHENVTVEELYHENMLFIPSKSIIVYIQKRNWLLAFILNEMYVVEDVQIDISEIRLKSFFNYLQVQRIQNLKELFDGNEIVTALQNCISSQKVRLYVQERMIKRDLLSIESQFSAQSHEMPPVVIPPSPSPDSPDSSSAASCETGEEIQENIKTTNWKGLFDVVDSIPESQLRKKPELKISRNNVLINLIQDAFEQEYYRFVHLIDDREARIDTILHNFKKWPGDFAIDIIRAEITKFDAVDHLKLEHLSHWLHRIELCEKVREAFEAKSWYKTYEICKKHPLMALEKMLQLENIEVLLDFIKIFKPQDEMLLFVGLKEILKLIETNSPFSKVKELLDSLPFGHTIDICNNLLTLLRRLDYLEFVADYLSHNVTHDHILENVRVSLKILSVFNPTEQEQLFCLVREPLDILEVLVMNTKLDKLAAVLEVLNLVGGEYDEDVISVRKVDSLLRRYAEKSLDFRVVTQPNPRLLRTPEHKLLQSVDSLNLNNEKRNFVVPVMVPKKDDWVPNEEVLECMCCQMVTFSMFNRRHHCRRCGRVICYACSTKRMLVDSYGDLMVRVCIDCYEQTIGSAERSEPHSLRSFHEYWLLNDDAERNRIMREEFSYEHAPSVSLCLSILKYHSKSTDYPKFLLEQCEFMLKLLQPSQEPTQEIDYLLVIKMLKSLAMAAKMLSAEYNLNAGIATADRILSQAELLGLLAEKGCLSLMPVLNTTSAQGSYVDAAVLRRLRDKLLEMEQWDLALEVSTKAGLDNAGIFAAWGKSCLKAGSLGLAREKFQRCLDKSMGHYETSSTLSRMSELNMSTDSLNRSRLSSRVSTVSSITSEGVKPTKDPPLLCEILRLLEEQTHKVRANIARESGSARLSFSGSVSSLNMMPYITVRSDPAINVLNRIRNLKDIARGVNLHSVMEDYSPNINRPQMDAIFYDECVYYLTRYGTHLSLLEFYVRHGDIAKALLNILENKLSSDLFVEIYTKCLKDGFVNLIQENMAVIDSSLEVWKDYLKQVCRHLEKHHLLNSLYQLQLFMGDYVRAAMTCIRFYQENVSNFAELSANVGHLMKAEEHLRQVLEQDQWVEVSSVGKSSLESKDSFEEKLLSSSSLIMRLENKDVNKHLMTIKRQIEVVEFLAKCENEGVNTVETLKDLLQTNNDPKVLTDPNKFVIPSLFGSNFDKISLVVLVMICGPSIHDGFSLASSLIQEFKLRPIKVYCSAGGQLAKCENYSGISQLVNCVKSSGMNDAAISDMLDEMLTLAVGTLVKANASGTKVEDLIKLIKDRATRISAYIEAKQLKTAYFLAVKYKRTADIRRIQREAELLNMPSIKVLCSKVLQNYSQSSSAHSQDDVL